jgi:hypothetical protein
MMTCCMSLFVIEQSKPKPYVLSTQTPMQTPRFRPYLLALAVAVLLGSVCLPAQAMTYDQASALAKSAWKQKDATALAQLRAAAQSGDANAQYNLGVMYEYGQGVPQDYAQAAYWYRKAAEQGDAVAQNCLGLLYEYGLGVPQDYAQALSWFRKAAAQGDAGAQFWLGFMYDSGQGVPQDYAQAAYWYRKAADQGSSLAQYNLGFMYDLGRGVPQDYAQALSWYLKASAQGDALAQNNLGVMYLKGLGVPQDYVIAYALFNLSATGYPSSYNPATNNRSELAPRMTPQQIAAGQELTRRMMKIGVLKAIDSWR